MTDERPAPLEWRRPFTRDVGIAFHPAAGEPDGSLLVALHGQGMTARRFARELLPAAPSTSAVLLPDAPMSFEIRRPQGIREGHSWYVYLGDSDAFVAELEATGEWLLSIVDDAVREQGVDPERVSLLGFSQGGYLAGFLGIRYAERFERLVVAGARMKHEVLEDAAKHAAKLGRPRVLCVHGSEDEAVSLDSAMASADQIREWGLDVSVSDYAIGHRVLRDEQCAADVRAFLSAD